MSSAKNIVLCSDGTGNVGGKIRGTNVWKIFQSVDRKGHLLGPGLPKQIAFHDDGVGTERYKPIKLPVPAPRAMPSTSDIVLTSSDMLVWLA